MKPPVYKIEDDYQTPDWIVEKLIPFIPPHIKTIWEPACGEGRIVRVLSNDRNVFPSDISPDKFQALQWNYLTDSILEFDAIITNPPYSKKNEFIAKCIELEKPSALLMPITALENSFGRHKLFNDTNVTVLVPDKRCNYYLNGVMTKGVPYVSAWFLFGDWGLSKNIYFV